MYYRFVNKDELEKYYVTHKMSMQEIADTSFCSVHKVEYWLKKYNIKRRSISDALFTKKHGLNDGFSIKTRFSQADSALYGLGVGIYWGEGNKRNTHAVRMGNSDPGLVNTFINFLVTICGVERKSIRYSLQLFTDVSKNKALNFWINELKIEKSQIMPTVNRVISGKIGTYRTKSQYGVITLYVFNVKLRNWLISQLKVPR